MFPTSKEVKIFINEFVKRVRKRFIPQKCNAEFTLPGAYKGPKIHIGCGETEIPGWINIDARSFGHVHIVTNSLDLTEFADGTIDEIYMCHVLEHLSFKDVDKVINKYYEKLRPNGILRISVPDFELLIKIYLELGKDLEFVKQALMGGQDYKDNFHRSVFDKKLLGELMKRSGFREIREWETEKEFGRDLDDWSSGSLHRGIRSFKVSLNLLGIK